MIRMATFFNRHKLLFDIGTKDIWLGKVAGIVSYLAFTLALQTVLSSVSR